MIGGGELTVADLVIDKRHQPIPRHRGEQGV
ncbi:hypothetical protein SAMN05216387_103320 [Nitrosovibrio tenuis]|uniref:Uncharacterized protein n=1 Tax=Nitrosovibrio tenuis TaxID=1233 RepID=A0A1H7KTV8_9PROT|nr:hypothetical protein SAMN05216387_103320 [Nitrosovibrio tenuis]